MVVGRWSVAISPSKATATNTTATGKPAAMTSATRPTASALPACTARSTSRGGRRSASIVVKGAASAAGSIRTVLARPAATTPPTS